MIDRLRQEIRQEGPFASLEEEAFLNLIRTSNDLWLTLAAVLRREDLTPTQYNALRILRGAGPGGLPCSAVGERMVTREPDITRLLDRLEKRGLVERERSTSDRRVVEARITERGRKLLATLDEPVVEAHHGVLGHLGDERLRQLIGLLEAARTRPKAE